MKPILIVVLAFVFCIRAGAQVQEIQQLKLDLEKLAQFKLILSQMKQGYQVLQNGYNSVRDAAKGNFNLHKNYFDELLVVSPSVKNSPALRQIASEQSASLRAFQAALQQYQSSGLFKASELSSLRAQYDLCVQRINEGLDVIGTVVSAGNLRMDDAERLQVMEVVRGNIFTECSAIRVLVADHSRLLALRAQQRKDNKSLQKLSGIK